MSFKVDASFGTSGTLSASFSSDPTYTSVLGGLMFQNPFIAVTGTVYDSGNQAFQYGVTLYSPDGTLKPGFTPIVTAFNSANTSSISATANNYSWQAIYVAGHDADGTSKLVSYSYGGIVNFSVSTEGFVFHGISFNYLSQNATCAGFDPATSKHVVATYAPDGTLLDKIRGSFTYTPGSTSVATCVYVTQDGYYNNSIIVGGYDTINGKTTYGLTKYSGNGSQIMSFGTTFSRFGQESNPSKVNSLGVQTTGHVVVAGSYCGQGFLARYTPAGVLDTTFGVHGAVLTNTVGSVESMTLQLNDMILTAGYNSDGKYVVSRYSKNGVLDTTFGPNAGSILGPVVSTSSPLFVTTQLDGAVLVGATSATTGQYEITRYAEILTGEVSLAISGLSFPSGACVDSNGNVYAGDPGSSSIVKSDQQGNQTTISISGLAFCGVAADASGNVYVADSGNHVIWKIHPDQTMEIIAGQQGQSGNPVSGSVATSTTLQSPVSICVDSSNNVYVADNIAAYVYKITPNGRLYNIAGLGYNNYSGEIPGPAIDSNLQTPWSVAVDASKNVYVGTNNAVVKIDPSGILSVLVNGATFYGYQNHYENRLPIVNSYGPYSPILQNGFPPGVAGIAVDQYQNVFFVDSAANSIYKLTPDGTVRFVAGNALGTSGPVVPGPVSESKLNAPFQLAVDAYQNLYVADSGNGSVDKIRFLNSDTSLVTLTANGIPVSDGSYVYVSSTADVPVVVQTTDPSASIVVSFQNTPVSSSNGTYTMTGIQPGDNLVSVLITSQSGIRTNTRVHLNLPIPADTSLRVFEIDQAPVTDGQTFYVKLSAVATIIPSNPDAAVAFSAGTPIGSNQYEMNGLSLGPNAVSLTVTAPDSTQQTYSLTLYALNNDSSISSFAIDGTTVNSGSTTVITTNPPDIQTNTSVAIVKTDPNARMFAPYGLSFSGLPLLVTNTGTDAYDVSGLVSGVNPVTFVVQAEDGTSTEYSANINLFVVDNDVSFLNFSNNQGGITSETTQNYPYPTTDVSFVFQPTNPNAAVSVNALDASGNPLSVTNLGNFRYNVSGLVLGQNTVNFAVTSTDQTTDTSYNVILSVLETDTTLAVFSVGGQPVVTAQTVAIPYGQVDVSFVIQPNNAGSTITGLNVTDPNGNTTLALTTDDFISYNLSGLFVGTTIITFNVTSAYGTTQSYTVNLSMQDTTLSVFTVNGTTVADGAYFDLSGSVTDIVLSIQPNNVSSTYTTPTGTDTNGDSLGVTLTSSAPDVYGVSGLILGTNVVTFTVTAADGVTTQSYTVNLRVLSNDTSLIFFLVDNQSAADGGYYTLSQQNNTSTSATIQPNDASATVQNLSTGISSNGGYDYTFSDIPLDNSTAFSFDVAAPDGTVQAYTVNVGGVSGPPPVDNNTSVNSISVNGQSVSPGGTVYLANGTTSASVSISAAGSVSNLGGSNSNAESLQLSGNTITNVTTGDNNVNFTITAPSGQATQDYSFFIHVSTSSEATAITINGTNASLSTDSGSPGVVYLANGTSSATIAVTTSDAAATYSIVPSSPVSLSVGANQVSVIVTSSDSHSQTTYYLNAYRYSNTSFTISVEGITVSPNSTVSVPYGDVAPQIVITPTDASATSVVTGGTGLQVGNNQVSVTVTGPDTISQTTATFTINMVAPRMDVSLASITLTIEGLPVVVTPGSLTHIIYGTTSIPIQIVPTDASANVTSVIVNISNTMPNANTISGLVPKQNQIDFTIYAQDGITHQTYTFNLYMDAQIICFREGTKIRALVNGKDVYVPIETLRRGSLVKTHKHGYVPIDLIGHSTMTNPGHSQRTKNRLYQCRPSAYPELFEPLFITGCHSILVDHLSEEARQTTQRDTGKIFATEEKYRLMAYIDPKAEPYKKAGEFQIWHLSLENDHYFANYGVYANGLLVESASKRMMRDYSGMKFV